MSNSQQQEDGPAYQPDDDNFKKIDNSEPLYLVEHKCSGDPNECPDKDKHKKKKTTGWCCCTKEYYADERMILKGDQLIKIWHPLSKAPLTKVLPYLCCFLRCCSKKNDDDWNRVPENGSVVSADSANEIAVIPIKDENDPEKDKEKKMPDEGDKLEVNNKDDLFLMYGTGVQSYFNFQAFLIYLFVLLCVLASPSMYFYYTSHGFPITEKDIELNTFIQFSYGNLGFAETKCSRHPIYPENGKLMADVVFQCQGSQEKGTWVAEIVDAGIISALDSNALVTCNLTEQIDTTMYIEMNGFDRVRAKEDLNSTCFGKDYCSTNIDVGQYNPEQVKKSYDIAQNTDDVLIFYTQGECKYTEEQLTKVKQKGYTIAAFCAVTCLAFSCWLLKKIKDNKNCQKEWDTNITTVGDYTAYIQLNDKIKKQLLGYHNNDDHTKLYKLKEQLQKEIENKLKIENTNSNNYKIATIQFAFDNSELIQLLEKRGQALLNERFEKTKCCCCKKAKHCCCFCKDTVAEIEEDMTKKKNKNIKQWTTPVGAFITFKTEQGLLDALNPDHRFAQDFALKKAEEPSDIIWENRSVSRCKLWGNVLCLVVIFIVITLFVFYGILYGLQAKNVFNYIINPPGSICPDKTEPHSNVTDEFMYSMAFVEYKTMKAHNQTIYEDQLDQTEMELNYHGYLSCFCSAEQTKLNSSKLPWKNYFNKHQYTLTDRQGNNESAKICEEWSLREETNLYFDGLIGHGIPVVTFVLTEVFVWSSQRVRFHTRTGEFTFIFIGAFLIQFINSGILVSLASISSEWNIPIIRNILNGYYTDLDEYWIKDYGIVIFRNAYTNIVLLFMPLFWWILRCIQRICSKPKNAYAYAKLNSGPNFEIHYKYSSLLSTVCVCFIYGSIMPLMYIVGLLYLIVFYTIERLSFAYSYRKPFILHNIRLNQKCMVMLYFSPVLYCFLAAWVFTNRQVFGNQVNLTDHNFSDLLRQASPGRPLTVYLIVMLVVYFCMLIGTCLGKKRDAKEKSTKEPYFDSLKRQKKTQWFSEEINNQVRLGIKTLDEDTIQELRYYDGKKDTSKLQSIHNYDILANPLYREKFMYTLRSVPTSYIISEYQNKEMKRFTSDVVRMYIDLAYFNVDKMRKIKFSPEYLFNQKPTTFDRQESINRLLRKYDTKKGLIQYSNLDENSDNQTDDSSIEN